MTAAREGRPPTSGSPSGFGGGSDKPWQGAPSPIFRRQAMDKTFFITLLMMVMTGVGVWTYCKTRITSLLEALTQAMAENAKLRVTIDAAGKTEEARKVCAVTLAALNAA